jgi:hypothetical protein
MMDEVQTFKFDYEDYAIRVRVEASNDDGITANRMDLIDRKSTRMNSSHLKL